MRLLLAGLIASLALIGASAYTLWAYIESILDEGSCDPLAVVIMRKRVQLVP